MNSVSQNHNDENEVRTPRDLLKYAKRIEQYDRVKASNVAALLRNAAKAWKDSEGRIPGTEFRVKLMEITPGLAQKWIDLNCKNNRAITESNVKRIQQDIEDDNWMVTHQGVAFEPGGKMIDGQHRATAIARSGITVPSLVWENVPESVFEFTDRGKQRNYHTILALAGSKYDNTIHGAMRLLTNLRYEYHRAYIPNSIEKIQETIGMYGEVAGRIQTTLRTAKKQYMANSQYFLCAIILGYLVNPDRTLDFTKKYVDGFGLQEGDAPGTLRTIVSDRYISSARLRDAEVFLNVCYALSKYIRGESVSRIQANWLAKETDILIRSSGICKTGSYSPSWTREGR